MRLPGRIAAAIDVLADIEARRRPASDALRDWGLAHRFAGSGDRAAIGNLVYDALRRRASHAFAMREETPRALALSVAVRDWGESIDSLADSFSVDAHAPTPLTEAERARLSDPDPLRDAPDPVRADIPEFLAPSFAQALGPDWVEEGRALTLRPPLDLRINTLKSDRARAEKALRRLDPIGHDLAPDCLRLPAGPRDARTPNVLVDEAWLKGWVEVQDAGSQLAARLSAPEPGAQVLDYCAGAGGKTLALAALMGNRGQVFAHDADRNRLAPIYERLKRAGVRNVQTRPPGPDALADLAGRMDLVVVDAPCTGSGTWRRRPDAKWRLSPEQLAARTVEQHEVLREALAFVRPGGRLAYITCSLLDDENRNQVRKLLAQNPDLSAISPQAAWQAAGLAEPAKPLWDDLGLTLSPHRTDTDGFYFALLRRAAQ